MVSPFFVCALTKWTTLTRPLPLCLLGGLVSLYEQLHTVRTDDPYFLGAADDSPALRAYPPPGAALCFGRLWGSCLAAARSFAGRTSAAHIRPRQTLCHLDILPTHEDDEVQQLFGRACNGPTVFLVMVND